MKSSRLRALLAAIGLVVATVGAGYGVQWYRASKVKEFLPIAEAFMARVEARDVATLKRLGLDSAGIASALALPPEQVRAVLRGRLRVASGRIDNDFALVTFDTDATFCPTRVGHAGQLDIQFVRQGGQWMVERADPSLC